MTENLLFVTLLLIFPTIALAQNNRAAPNSVQKTELKTNVLPPGISGWNGKDADRILKNPSIVRRLRKLLGKQHYADFIELLETVTPITKNGSVLFASGCPIHACGHLESAVAIDLSRNTVHAAIYNEEKKTAYFDERGSKTPQSIIVWANRLNELRK